MEEGILTERGTLTMDECTLHVLSPVSQLGSPSYNICWDQRQVLERQAAERIQFLVIVAMFAGGTTENPMHSAQCHLIPQVLYDIIEF